MTKRRRPTSGASRSPDGSAVFEKSRLRRYSASWLRAPFVRRDAVATAECYAVLRFVVRRLRAGAAFFRPDFFAVPCSRLARSFDMRSSTPVSGASSSGSSSCSLHRLKLAIALLFLTALVASAQAPAAGYVGGEVCNLGSSQAGQKAGCYRNGDLQEALEAHVWLISVPWVV